jgi:hypothetical protein
LRHCTQGSNLPTCYSDFGESTLVVVPQGQLPTPAPATVPTLSQLGLYALAVLMLITAMLLIRSRS